MKMLLIAVMTLLAGSAAAQVNKCIDKNGKVVGYGNECPAGSRSEQMTIQKGPSAAPAQKSTADRDADFRKRQVQKQETEQKDAKKSAEADQRKQACEQSKAQLKSLENGNRIARTDPKTGERTFLQDNEYAGETAKARASVAANCK